MVRSYPGSSAQAYTPYQNSARTPVPKTPASANDQALTQLYLRLFPIPQAIYRSSECIYHLIVHYVVVTERSCKDCPVHDWKESRSELTR